MEQEFSLEQFFSMEYEMLYNKCFSCPLTEEQETNVMEYIKRALSTPLSEFFQYIKENPKASFDVGHMFAHRRPIFERGFTTERDAILLG